MFFHGFAVFSVCGEAAWKDESMTQMKTFYTSERSEWRAWLAANFEREPEIWLVFPMKAAEEPRLSYNDAVEEALCFGWIDTTICNLDALHRAQRFCPRRKGSPYSRANIERLIWLESREMLHPAVRESVLEVIRTPYAFPEDILQALRQEPEAWENYEQFPEAYRQIRVAYIDAARKRPEEFRRRLESFLRKTKENKLIGGYGGIDKYYHEDAEKM